MSAVVPRRVDLVGSYAVRIRAVYNSGAGRVLNLSPGGAYVETPMYLLPQAQVRLQIVLGAERRWVETEAVVAWENRGMARRGDLPRGYGLRFINVPADTRATIHRLMASVAAAAEVASGAEAAAARVRVPRAEEARIPSSAQPEAVEEEGPPYRLMEEVVHRLIPEPCAGVFLLSYDGTQDARVGRADDDLRRTLTGFVGEYAYFYHEVIDALEDRFSRECELFHRLGGDHGQLDNSEHPALPVGANLTCPVCASGGAEERPSAEERKGL